MILSPDNELLTKAAAIIDDVNELYVAELEMNNDMDDIYSLADMLQERCDAAELGIEWAVYDDPRDNPDDWMSGMASYVLNIPFLQIILWEQNLVGKWGPKTFKEIALKAISHETIHFAQYDRMGGHLLDNLESGYQKAMRLTSETKDKHLYMKLYLSDPHELMAYGHDLATEIKFTDDPEDALRNPEKYIDDLPVYNQYRLVWPRDAKPLRKLMSYAARYFEADISLPLGSYNKYETTINDKRTESTE